MGRRTIGSLVVLAVMTGRLVVVEPSSPDLQTNNSQSVQSVYLQTLDVQLAARQVSPCSFFSLVRISLLITPLVVYLRGCSP